MTLVVDSDDLEVDDAGVHFLGDEAFTGEAVETTSTGTVLSRTAFSAGVEEGTQRIWYLSGALKYECTLRDGTAVGLATSWYESGTKEEERTFDDQGRLVARRQWNEQGRLLVDDAWSTEP